MSCLFSSEICNFLVVIYLTIDAQTQAFAEQWVALAMALEIEHKDEELKLDSPNFHLLIEVVIRQLPILRDMSQSMTNRYEAMHKFNKKKIGSVHSTVGSTAVNFVIKESIQSEALSFVFNSGRWGINLEHQGSSTLMKLKENRKKSNKVFFCFVLFCYFGLLLFLV